MAYSAQILRHACLTLADMKTAREYREQERLLQIYAKLPRVKEIDQKLRHTIALAVQAAFAAGTDAQAAMEQVKQTNLALQEERKQLILEHFGPEYLEQGPVCKHCSDTGYVGSNMCRCLQTLCSREQKKQIPLLSAGEASFDQFRLDYYSDEVDRNYGASHRRIMQKTLEACRKFALTFGKESGNLLLTGNTGLGKTFLSACIADVVSDRGYGVCYETAASLFDKLEKARFHPDEESHTLVEEIYQCDLLILDDLGTEMTGQFVVSALYALLNERLMNGRSMVISTNLNMEDIARRYSSQIASRLQGHFQMRTFVGKDIRLIRNGGV